MWHHQRMWVIRAWKDLSNEDMHSWNQLIDARLELDVDVPLAQRTCWGSAMASLGLPTFLVFNSALKIGGLLFEADGNLECTNGPLLDWHEPGVAQAQLDDFIYQTKLSIPDYEHMIVHPRWFKNDEATNLKHMMVDPEEIHYAASFLVPVQDSEAEQVSHYGSRLKRGLKKNQESDFKIRVEKATRENIPEILVALKEGEKKENVFLPPALWFENLISSARPESIEWLWIQATHPTTAEFKAETHLFVGYTKTTAYYLFGADIRSETTPSWISTARLAHHSAITEARKRGVLYYDFNGFKEDTDPSDPYHSINQFKQDWGGQIISYSAPLFVF